jgi:Ca2+-transporting ATPase
MDHAPSRPWHATSVDEACRALDTSTDGLDADTAATRLTQFGPNVLSLAPPIAAWRVLLAQFQSVVVLLLAVAAGVAWLTADPLDALAIGAVLVVNAAIGFVTEIRARRAIESLTTLTPRPPTKSGRMPLSPATSSWSRPVAPCRPTRG